MVDPVDPASWITRFDTWLWQGPPMVVRTPFRQSGKLRKYRRAIGGFLFGASVTGLVSWFITSASTAQAAAQSHQSYQWFTGWSIGLIVVLAIFAGIGLAFLISSIGEPSLRDAIRADLAAHSDHVDQRLDEQDKLLESRLDRFAEQFGSARPAPTGPTGASAVTYDGPPPEFTYGGGGPSGPQGPTGPSGSPRGP